jgi:hypothetical protein
MYCSVLTKRILVVSQMLPVSQVISSYGYLEVKADSSIIGMFVGSCQSKTSCCFYKGFRAKDTFTRWSIRNVDIILNVCLRSLYKACYFVLSSR